MTLVEKGLPNKNKQSSLNYNIFPIISFDLREITSQLASTLLLRLPAKVTQRRRADCHAVATFVTVPRWTSVSSSDDVKKREKSEWAYGARGRDESQVTFQEHMTESGTSVARCALTEMWRGGGWGGGLLGAGGIVWLNVTACHVEFQLVTKCFVLH